MLLNYSPQAHTNATQLLASGTYKCYSTARLRHILMLHKDAPHIRARQITRHVIPALTLFGTRRLTLLILQLHLHRSKVRQGKVTNRRPFSSTCREYRNQYEKTS